MTILLIVLLTVGVLVRGDNRSAPFLVDEEDALMTVPQLIRKYGYEVEEHQVGTEDGYLLGMYRIPARRGPRKQPVFMMHSLFSSCSDWVLIGREHGLAYLLAERGYDVWIGNARGTRYSRKHERISVSAPQFWDFTFHEIGFYDIPALVDYVLEQTGDEKVHYIGFSQGAMTIFITLSQRPEFNDKIVQLQALSPAVYMYRTQSAVIRLLVSNAQKIAASLAAVGKYDLFSHWEKQYYFFQWLCPAPAQTLCRLLVYDLVGANPEQLDVKMLRIFFGHFPAGASTKQLLHYAQIIRDGIFRQYDYGDPDANRAAYGSSLVPMYNLSRVVAPVRTYFGYNDNVINYLNVLQLNRELPNLVGTYPVPDKRFSHIDFILANAVREVLYAEIVRNVEAAELGFGQSVKT